MAGDTVKILLPFISNTICKCFLKKHLILKTLINHVLGRLSSVKKLSAITWRCWKNSLITKLLTNVNFLIFHNRVFLVKLSISQYRRKVFLLRFWKNHEISGFNVLWSEYILKSLPASVLLKSVVFWHARTLSILILAHYFYNKQSRRVWGSDGEMRMILSKVKV